MAATITVRSPHRRPLAVLCAADEDRARRGASRYPGIGNTQSAGWILVAWLLCAASALAQDEFAVCLERLERVARDRGISDATIDEVFPTIEPRPRVIEADRSQPEFVETFRDYLTRRVNERRVRIGREQYSSQRAFLASLTARYGVPGQYVLAFWALETDFGNVLGDVSVFDSLSTLACEGRRGDYFSSEFVNALELAAAGHVATRAMRGSWAGAMGQTQFMPSTYLQYAVDGDGDGRIDLWNERDALASAAHFLQQLGWAPGWRWGREVVLPDDFDYALAGRDQARSLGAWARLGLTDVTGRGLPDAADSAAVLVPAGRAGPAFLVYENFDVIMRWNRSEFFALTVGHLADRIAGGAELLRPPPVAAPLARADIERLQRYLAARGYDVGPADGLLGPRSQAAVRALQRDRGLVADGYVSRELLDVLDLTAD
jgi:peptidoglycan lytic transglycosylase B